MSADRENLSVADLVSMAFPDRTGETGVLLMLQCYLDDSGTHADSDVLVWGAAIGTPDAWMGFDEKWEKLLSAPLPGKAALTKFSLSKCAAPDGEFASYKIGERDLIRNLFREVIASSAIFPIAFGVAKKEYEKTFSKQMRQDYSEDTEIRAFIPAVARCIDYAVFKNEKQVALVFDQGREKYVLDGLKKLLDDPKYGDRVTSYAFAKVADFNPLQAADTIATEHYWNCKAILTGNDQSPHMKHFIKTMRENNTSGPYYFMGAEAVRELAKSYEADPMSGPPVFRG